MTDYIPNIRKKGKGNVGSAGAYPCFDDVEHLDAVTPHLPMIPFLRAGLNLKVQERVLSNQHHVCDGHN